MKLSLTLRLVLLCATALINFADTKILPLPQVQEGLVWDSVEKTVDLKGMTNIAYFQFFVTNNTSEEVTILSTETTCDCTVVEAGKKLPWKLGPGEGGELRVRVNTLGRFGLFERAVTVKSSLGFQQLAVKTKIPLTPAPFNRSVRETDVIAAKADRQAVFKGGCATCHSLPTHGKTGEALFNSACGICHKAEHRADFVPDLHRITHLTDADYWRKMISSGKHGTMMPAFAQSEGGILDTNQVESLVKFMLQRFPPTLAAEPAKSAGTSAKPN